MTVVFSRRDAEWFAPPGTDRRYLVAPLTYRERQAFRADLAREGGIYPSHAQMLDALRAAVREASPDNADEVLAVIDASEATPDDADVQVQLGTIEAACATVPVYAGLLAARQRYLGTLPWVAARHALRGWEGDGLPTFRRTRGLVPDDLLDALPQEDVEAVGWRASSLMQPGRDAEGNSGAPSPSPETPAPTTAA
ncbi:hypothetical protein [Falsiroseomonas ponticola]|uniref:hypothetical protein n=1 Tax=Falsiroseomonas ponticola TaxID=2786951 RepID=UPI0019331AC0|nr:hypothetical protein [Roseomonas ponticola]